MKVGNATVEREAFQSVNVKLGEQSVKTDLVQRTTEDGEERDERSACTYEDDEIHRQ